MFAFEICLKVDDAVQVMSSSLTTIKFHP